MNVREFFRWIGTGLLLAGLIGIAVVISVIIAGDLDESVRSTAMTLLTIMLLAGINLKIAAAVLRAVEDRLAGPVALTSAAPGDVIRRAQASAYVAGVRDRLRGRGQPAQRDR